MKRSIEDLNINEALNKANELIDYYDKIKSNPNSYDYIKAFIIRTIDIFDPLNIASGIILKDIELTLPKQIYNLLNDITNPNISSKEKAKAIGTLVGILFNTYYSIRIFKKEINKFKERFSNVYKDNYEIIKKSIDDFSYIDTRLTSKTIILLDKIASKLGRQQIELEMLV